MTRFWTVSLLVVLAFAALAFGSPYPWAYVPLLWACLALGLWGMLRGSGQAPMRVSLALIAVALAISVQLAPLPTRQLELISPNAMSLIRQFEIVVGDQLITRHALSINPDRTLLGLSFMVPLAILLVGAGRMFTRESARLFAGGLAIVGAAIALIGIVQSATFDGKIYGFWQPYQRGVSYGPFVNRNHFAGWMVMAIPCCLGLLMAKLAQGRDFETTSWREYAVWLSSTLGSQLILFAFVLLLMSLSLILTLSRSGIIAFVFALIIFRTLIRRSSSTARLGPFLTRAVLLVLALSLAWAGTDRIAARLNEPSALQGAGRTLIWADTLRIARDFWLTGTGFNTYGLSTLFYQTSMPGEHLQEAHNDYLQLAAEGGVLLTVPIAVAIAAVALQIRRRLRQDVGSIRWVRIGAIASLMGMAVQSIFDFSLQMPANAALFATIAGLAIHDGRQSSREKVGARQDQYAVA